MVGPGEWDVFVALLDSLYFFAIPSAGLQAVFAQLAAGAVDDARRARLLNAVRSVFWGLGILSVLVVVAVWVGQNELLSSLKIRNPVALWLTVGVGMATLWSPLFTGLLQGSQRFFWYGYVVLAGGAGRLLGILIFVMALGGQAAGAVSGVLMGGLLGLALAVGSSRPEWRGWLGTPRCRSERVEPWVAQWIWLSLGMAPVAIMMASDTLVVQAQFDPDGKKLVLAAGRIARGMVTLTTPMALVLFPRVARSAATGEATGALRLALGSTLGVGVCVALGCTILPGLAVKVLFLGNPNFDAAAQYVPWAVWCMLPLTAATTLINHLLARKIFVSVPWLVGVAAAYALTLVLIRDRLAALPIFDAFRQLIVVVGAFNVLLLIVAVVFSFRRTGAATAELRV